MIDFEIMNKALRLAWVLRLPENSKEKKIGKLSLNTFLKDVGS